MKTLRLIIVASVLATTLCSCSEDSTTKNQSSNSRVSKDNVFSDQVRALEKAEQVEDQIMDAFKKRDASIDDN